MANLEEVMKSNPPRLAIIFQRDDNGQEQFQWGVTGAIPLLSLIGAVSRITYRLSSGGWVPSCEERALIIAYDEPKKLMHFFLNKDIPTDPLIGMLEAIKSVLINGRMGQHAASQKIALFGADGSPLKG